MYGFLYYQNIVKTYSINIFNLQNDINYIKIMSFEVIISKTYLNAIGYLFSNIFLNKITHNFFLSFYSQLFLTLFGITPIQYSNGLVS